MPTRASSPPPAVDDLGPVTLTTVYYYDPYGNLAREQEAHATSGLTTSLDTRPITSTRNRPSTRSTRSLPWYWTPPSGSSRLSPIPNNTSCRTYDYDEFGRPRRAPGPAVPRSTCGLPGLGLPAQPADPDQIIDAAPPTGYGPTPTSTASAAPTAPCGTATRPASPTPPKPNSANATSAPYRQASQWSRSGPPPFETFSYDTTGRLTRDQHPDGSGVRFGYDTDGTTTTVRETDELGHAKTLSFDPSDRLAGVLQRDAKTAQTARTAYTYDATGNLVRTVDPQQQPGHLPVRPARPPPHRQRPRPGSANLHLLPRRRPAHRNHGTQPPDRLDLRPPAPPPDRNLCASTGQTIHWTYDQPGHGNSIGELTSATNLAGNGCPGGTTDSYSYDAIGLSSHTQCVNGATRTTTFGHDPLWPAISDHLSK